MTDEDMFPSLFAEAVVPARLADPGGRGALAGGAGGRAGAGALPGEGVHPRGVPPAHLPRAQARLRQPRQEHTGKLRRRCGVTH